MQINALNPVHFSQNKGGIAALKAKAKEVDGDQQGFYSSAVKEIEQGGYARDGRYSHTTQNIMEEFNIKA